MSLYGRTDSNTNVTKARRGIAVTSQDKQVIFVDETEASLDENRQRGIHGPGWWSYYTFTDCEGNTRHKAEMLVSLADADTNAHETQADDTVAADKQYVILYEDSEYVFKIFISSIFKSKTKKIPSLNIVIFKFLCFLKICSLKFF